MTSIIKNHIERMLNGEVVDGISLKLGENTFDTNGFSRGEASISILRATRYESGYEMVEVNDEARGKHGSYRKEDVFKILDEEESLAASAGRTLSIGTPRNRRIEEGRIS